MEQRHHKELLKGAAMGKLRGSKRQQLTRFVLMLLVVFYAPSILISRKVIPFELRFHVLVLMALGLAIYAMRRGNSLRELGFRLDSLGTSPTMNIILSATVIAALGVAYSRGFFHARAVPRWACCEPFLLPGCFARSVK